MTIAYIGLGSNLGDPLSNILSAIDHLKAIPSTQVIRVSSFYRSVAVGPGEQPDYVNAAVTLQTQLDAETLLDQLQAIEQTHHRTRGPVRWTARTLDLDILLFGNAKIETERLSIPHPRMSERNFVLLPLQDLNPELRFPDGVCLSDLVKMISQTGITQLTEYPAHSCT
ncbi:MAG: 2-amino-4-hydroxy-6-hydroxymethyldihydropteridine diphosphokinase [Pseudomonadales bacterium]|nr:2-amino-4-hydroxy-6-hydroxymethyldihydropteridine diphosphokinase [Pseudomonadales bacterium]